MNTIKAELVRTENSARQIYDQHCHGDFEILYILSGSTVLNLEGEQLRLQENTGVVVEPLKYHIVTEKNSRYHRLVLTFSPEAVPEAVYDRFLSRVRANALFSEEEVCRIFGRFSAVLERQEPAFEPLLQALLTEGIYALAYENTDVQPDTDGKPKSKLKQIVSLVEGNLHRQISLEDIAGQLFMSESSLCHLFRQEMGISLKQYILQKKMMYAKSLLQKGTAPGAAAALCGYKNYASFYKVFRKITGMTPGQLQPGE